MHKIVESPVPAATEPPVTTQTAEAVRLEEGRQRTKRWGPYVSERAWGSVREDYSPGGTAWDYFPHDHARSRAYRWNEDGLAGICDRHQKICFALALWNGRDPILKDPDCDSHQQSRSGDGAPGPVANCLVPKHVVVANRRRTPEAVDCERSARVRRALGA